MPKIEILLKAKYKKMRYEYAFTVGADSLPISWQASNILDVPNNGTYWVWIRNKLTLAVTKNVAIVNCVDGENVCTVVVEALQKGFGCAVTVDKLVKLDKPVVTPYSFEILGIERVGTEGCRYELKINEPSNHKNLKVFHVKLIKVSNGVTVSERDVELDTALYDRIGVTLVNDGVNTVGEYRFDISVSYEGKSYGDTLTENFTADELCTSDPCAGKSTAPEWTTTGSPFCDGADLKAEQTQTNVCCVSPAQGSKRTVLVQAGAAQCQEGGGDDGGGPITSGPGATNPNVEMIIDHVSIIGRFRQPGASGVYTGVARLGNTQIQRTENLTYGSGGNFVQMTIPRFQNGMDYAGKTLVWEFSRQGHDFAFEFFTPEIVYQGHEPDFDYWTDTVLLLRYKRPFDSESIVHEDYGNNMGMNPIYLTNGTQYRNDAGQFDCTILSPVPVPPMKWVDIVKSLVDTQVQNVNDDGWKLFYGSPPANKFGGALDFWYRTEATQNQPS